ncbi:MAG: hypothetical protein DWQ31_16610 [Planctomycetota bacterium]|nr:MAG: hypothetical protein DWQ31_16610 [Planctomycetota bacterium]
MSLHSDLMLAGRELIASVHGTPAGARYWPPDGDPVLVDLVAVGEITVEEELVPTGRGLEQTRRIEKLSLRLADPPELALNGRFELVTDETRETPPDVPDTWEIANLRGVGTSAVLVELRRPWKMATGRAGRHQRTN